MSVLFVGARDLQRASNLKAVWDAFDGEKVFTRNRPFYKPLDGEIDYRLAYELGYELIISDDYLEPLVSPDKVTVVDVGHGVDGGKVCGIALDYMDEMWTDQVDYYVVASDAAGRIRAGETGQPLSKMLSLGVPRTDCYFSGLSDDGFFLMAPTFRKERDGGGMDDYDERRIDSVMGGMDVVLKPHPESTAEHAPYGSVSIASKDVSTEPYLKKCSLLITDYSSILFDAAIAGKPTVLFSLDSETYLGSRGMYLPYPRGYSRHWASSYGELADACEQALVDQKPTDEVLELVEMCDGRSTDRVVGLIQSLLTDA